MLIVGLGNPGSQYETNLHNVGWLQLDKFAKQINFSFALDKKHKAMVARANYKGTTLTLAKPLTYMNLSGESVVSLANYYKYSNEQIIIVYDDKDFDLGIFKIKQDGSAAGHNGIKSIMSCIGAEKFIRFRIGVGPKPKEREMANFVLSNFSKKELEILEPVLERGIDALDSLIFDGVEKAMNFYNQKLK